MAATKKGEVPAPRPVKEVSTSWREIYADSAFIGVDAYSGRISFLSHRADLAKEGAIIESRVVDIVIPKKSLLELAAAINSIVDVASEEGHEK